MWQLGFQVFIAVVFHAMDVYKLQWPLLVLVSCRNVLHLSAGGMNGYRVMLKWWGGKKGINVGSFEDIRAITATELGRGYDLVLSQQANPAMQGGKTNRFSLHFPVHCCDWTNSLKPSYITDTCVYFQPIPIHPPGLSQSPWSWGQYITAKHQN